MADKKENELTSANKFEWVRALDSNGNSIRISKSDLVSVLEGLLPNNIRKHVAISSKGMKITFPNNSNNTFIIIVCGHNTSGCGIAYIMCSIEEMKSIVLGKNPILNIKRKITGNNIELYFFHSGCYLTVDILRNHTNYLPVYSIINSADEIPSDAENINVTLL